MELKDVLTAFRERIGKKVIAYEDKGNHFILITEPSLNNKYDTRFYKVTPNDITVTNPILCDLNEDRVVKL